MTVHINGSKAKDLYYGGTKIKEAYYNGNKVYSSGPLYYCYCWNNTGYIYFTNEITTPGSYRFYYKNGSTKASSSSQLTESYVDTVSAVYDSYIVVGQYQMPYYRYQNDDLYT